MCVIDTLAHGQIKMIAPKTYIHVYKYANTYKYVKYRVSTKYQAVAGPKVRGRQPRRRVVVVTNCSFYFPYTYIYIYIYILHIYIYIYVLSDFIFSMLYQFVVNIRGGPPRSVNGAGRR